MSYTIGDIPATDLTIEPVRTGPDGEQPVDLAPFTEATATLYGPDFEPVTGPGLYAEIGEGIVIVEWPTTTPFEQAGLYHLRVIVENTATGVREALPDVRLVVDDPSTGWHTCETARADWPSAPGYDAWLFELLETAKQQVIAYAPKLAEGAKPPVNYRRGQLLQARNSWNASMVDPSNGSYGEDSFVVTPHPLDWHIKQVLRPKSGVPVVS